MRHIPEPATMEKICVAVRVRPHLRNERVKGSQWKIVENTISLCSALGTPISGHSFAFDHVFGSEIKNGGIYSIHTQEVITAALRGFNGTVFAYGQTSSGKTYTMQGTTVDPGLIRLAVHDVFNNIQKFADREYLIRVSYMEIYNEDINDLLAPENRKLQIHENLERGVFVAGLREEIVNSPEQVFELLKFGEVRRHVGQTNMNIYSSRSHTIFRMVIESKDKSQHASLDAVRVSVLNLVDLAGSERISKTGAGGARLKEGTHINKSLMTLGNVIKKLSDCAGRQGGHIPYRDSKLTRILQPALGGNAKTAIICTVAPDEIHVDETRGTLLFASRAKKVTTCAQVNEILTDAALLKRQQKEIEDLREKLQGSRSEVLEQEILHLRNDLLKFELEREKLALELQEERKAQLEREQRIKEQEQKIENLSTLVITSTLDDHDNQRLSKQSDCRDVHTQQQSLEDQNQDSRTCTGRGPSESSFDNLRITVRGGRHQTPPSFQKFPHTSGEKDCSYTNWIQNIPVPLDFGNIADEDMWLSMNDGHAQAELDFLQSTPTCSVSSAQSALERTSSFMHGALKKSQAEVEKMKAYLNEVLMEKAELQNHLHKALEFQTQLKIEIVEMEREVASAKLASEVLQESVGHSLRETTNMVHARKEIHKTYFQNLEERVKDLELELSRYKKENSEFQLKCQRLSDQLHNLNSSGFKRRESIQNESRQLVLDDLLSLLVSDQGVRALHESDYEVNEYCTNCLAFRHPDDELVDRLTPAYDDMVVDANQYPNQIQQMQNFRSRSEVDRFLANVNSNQVSASENAISGSTLQMSQAVSESKEVLVPEFLKSFWLPTDISALELEQISSLDGFLYQSNIGVKKGDALFSPFFEESNHIIDEKAGNNEVDILRFYTKGRNSQDYQVSGTDIGKTGKKHNQEDLKSTIVKSLLLGAGLQEQLHLVLEHNLTCLCNHVRHNSNIGMLVKKLWVIVVKNARFAFNLLQRIGREKLLSTSEVSMEVEQKPLYCTRDVNAESEKMQQNLDILLPRGKWILDQKGDVSTFQIDSEQSSESRRVEFKDLQQHNQDALIERLRMSGEHIIGLEQQLVLANLEKERTCKALVEQLDAHEESMLAIRLEKLKLAKEFKRFVQAFAVQDNLVTAIRQGIEEFEKGDRKKQIFQNDLSCIATAQV